LWCGKENIFVVDFLAVGAVEVEVKAVGVVNLSAARTNLLDGSNRVNVRRHDKKVGLIILSINYYLMQDIVLVL